MFIALLIVHVLVAIGLVFVVLLQSGRGAELGAAFGGVGQSTFGRGQSTFITKFTTTIAVIFMTTSLSLAFLTIERPATSVMSGGTQPPVQAESADSQKSQPGTLPTSSPAPVQEPAPDNTPPLQQQDAPPPSSTRD